MSSLLRTPSRLPPPLGMLRRAARRLRRALWRGGYRPELHYMRGGQTSGSRGAKAG